MKDGHIVHLVIRDVSCLLCLFFLSFKTTLTSMCSFRQINCHPQVNPRHLPRLHRQGFQLHQHQTSPPPNQLQPLKLTVLVRTPTRLQCLAIYLDNKVPGEQIHSVI